MKRWDWLLVATVVLVTVGVGAFDWRLGCVVLACCVGSVWYWLGEPDEERR